MTIGSGAWVEAILVAWYIVWGKEIAGSDARVNCKAFGRAEKVLEMPAKELGVVPLMQFYSAARDELACAA